MFTIEEITLIKYCLGVQPNRENVIKTLKEHLKNADEEEMQEMIEEVLRKLTAMTDDQFKKIDFSLALDVD